MFSFEGCSKMSLRFRNTKCESLSAWIDVDRLRPKIMADRSVQHRSTAARVHRLCPVRAVELYVRATGKARASLEAGERDALFISEKALIRGARAGAKLGAPPLPRSKSKGFFPVGLDTISKDLKEVMEDGDMPEVGGRKAGPHYLRGLCASLLSDFGVAKHQVLNRVRDSDDVFRKNYYRKSTAAVLGRMARARSRLQSNEAWSTSEIPFV